EVDEYESLPGLERTRVQPETRAVEAHHLRYVRGGDEPAIQGIGPGVIRAGEGLSGRAFALAQPRPSMPADVVEGPQRLRIVPDDENVLVHHVTNHEVARGGDLLLATDAEPVAIEDAFFLEVEDFRRVVVPGWKRRPHLEGSAIRVRTRSGIHASLPCSHPLRSTTPGASDQ